MIVGPPLGFVTWCLIVAWGELHAMLSLQLDWRSHNTLMAWYPYLKKNLQGWDLAIDAPNTMHVVLYTFV